MGLARVIRLSCVLVVFACASSQTRAAEPFLTVASTTSTEQSGLFKHLLPAYTRKTGVGVRVVALGTGQAIDMARRGDADVVFVHDRAAEEEFVKEGFGVRRHEVMYNDYLLIGPQSDPARVGGSNIILALTRIAGSQVPFVSRGDKSGTHAAELRFWRQAGIDIGQQKGSWYRETGSGMGPSLNTASASDAYIISDRGTWLSFKNRGQLKILVAGDQRLFNQYAVILVNSARHPHVKKELGERFIGWLLSSEGQEAIAAYRINGQQLFFPNARRP